MHACASQASDSLMSVAFLRRHFVGEESLNLQIRYGASIDKWYHFVRVIKLRPIFNDARCSAKSSKGFCCSCRISIDVSVRFLRATGMIMAMIYWIRNSLTSASNTSSSPVIKGMSKRSRLRSSLFRGMPSTRNMTFQHSGPNCREVISPPYQFGTLTREIVCSFLRHFHPPIPHAARWCSR